ncbi:MAG: DUF134 domain-containing protein [Bacteroidales bacterium]|nr:DUF134 domain-containing protein [Bacteroidales bacterium]MDD4529510.1 DUF134 domain-containing protein [Bacteroidales bacterium]
MPRPKKIRRMTSIPTVSGFKPYGINNAKSKENAVFLLCEEYEALRLNDYEKCNQCEAATIMQVSRPTFTRIYMSARQKIASAFIEGRQIIIEGGKVQYDQNWYLCNDCKCSFNRVEETPEKCPLCGSKVFQEYSPEISNKNTPYLKQNDNRCGRGKCKNRNFSKRYESENENDENK